ncbi:MAG: TonB-dependent receptor [Ferruginibacter sp.]|nr:TonB-dependent receptor [Cytophagales bacterium]
MPLFLSGVACLLSTLPGHAQTVTVRDQTTRQPLPGCTIYRQHPPASTTTDAKGQADFAPFRGADSVFFRLINHQPVAYSYRQLLTREFRVDLEEDNISLMEVVVSANRWEQAQTEVPQRIEKISAREIAFQNPQTAADLLGSGGYAYIQKSQQAGGSPMLRGFATNRVMIVVDGVRMNNAIFRTGNLQNVISLDAGSVESAEILFGPGAVMYGSDAIGGVMDFHTVGPRLSTTGKTRLTGSAFSRFSSVNAERTGHLDLNIGLKKVAFTSSLTHSDYGDLRTGSRGNAYFLRPDYQERIDGVDSLRVNADPQQQVQSGYRQYNVLQKVRFKPGEAWDLEYAFHYSATSDAPRYDRLYLKDSPGRFTHAEWYYGPQKWMMNRLGIQHNRPSGWYDRLRLVTALQHYEESRHDRRRGSSQRRNQVETVRAYSFNLDLDKALGESTRLFYGAEIIHNRVGSSANRAHIRTGETTAAGTRYPDGSTWRSYAAYASLKHNFTPRWILNAGSRYSYFAVDATFDTTALSLPFTTARNRHGSLNGSLGLVYKASETGQWYLNGATGFRAPNVDDIGKVFESEPGSLVVPNPDLKPEYAYSAEFGTAKTVGSFLKVDLSAYYTLLDRALARRNFAFNGQDRVEYEGETSQVQAIQNITRARVWGLQAGTDLNFGKGIKLSSILSYQRGEEQSENDLENYPLRHAPPLFGSTHLVYERKKFKFDAYAVYNARVDYGNLALSERDDSAPYAKDANGQPFVPGWYTLNVKAAWFVNQHLILNAGLENLTDQLYRPYASGISAPGRNLMVALRGQL